MSSTLNLVLMAALLGCTGGHGPLGSRLGGCIMFAVSTLDMGVIELFLFGDVVTIKGSLQGLPNNSYLGLHVHYSDDSLPSGKKCVAGPHFNPFNRTHGCPGRKGERHAGDLGNIISSNGGFANILIRTNVSNFYPGEKKATARKIILHMGIDDCGKGESPSSSIDGNAGSPIACCELHLNPTPFPERTILSSINGRCITGTHDVTTQMCVNRDDQMWEFQPNGVGGFQLVSRESGKCVTYRVGQDIGEAPCSKTKYQQWMVEPITISTNGEVYIKSQEDQHVYLTVADDIYLGKENGVKLYLFVQLGPHEAKQQYWVLDPPFTTTGGGFAPDQTLSHGILQNVFTGSCLHMQVKDPTKAQFAPLDVAKCNYYDKYQYMNTGNWRGYSGIYGHLVFLATGYCLHEERNHTDWEINNQASCNGLRNAESILYRISAGDYAGHFQLQSTTRKCLAPIHNEIHTVACKSERDAPNQFWTILPPVTDLN